MSAPWSFARHAVRLARAGYEPIPIKLRDKAPAMTVWQGGCPQERWPEFANCGVGLLTRDLPTVDIDTMDQAIGDALQELVDQHIGDAPVRYGDRPKRAMPFRLAGAQFGKMKVSWRALDGTGDEGREPRKPPGVEVLAKGQQFVALGIHPGTLKPYRWERDPDLTIPRGLLPPLDEATARRFIGVVTDFIRDIGGELIGHRPEPETVARQRWQPESTEAERIAAALDQIGNPDLHYDDWIRIGHAIKAELGDAGLGVWCSWSAKSAKDCPAVTARKWSTFRPTTIGAGSIFYLLKGL